jgi:hypothetical protein
MCVIWHKLLKPRCLNNTNEWVVFFTKIY